MWAELPDFDWEDEDEDRAFKLPPCASRFARDFDAGESVEPFEFEVDA